MIGYRTVLTAARCLYDYTDNEHPTQIDRIDVFPGVNGYGNAPTGYGVYKAVYWETNAQFRMFGHLNNYVDNYAVIVLDGEVGKKTGVMPITVAPDTVYTYPLQVVKTAGYPIDKPHWTQWIEVNQVTGPIRGSIISSSFDFSWGQQGAPVIWQSNGTAFGLLSHSDSSSTLITPISDHVLELVDRVCQKYNDPCRSIIRQPNPEPTPPTNPPPTPVPGDPTSSFQRTWARTDQPVASGQVSRTWMWGPQPNTAVMQEPYIEGASGVRNVVYYDKSRMEIATDPAVPANTPWYVTNGLLAKELMTGELMLGNDSFEQHQPAQVNAAGDANDPTGPTYATLGKVQNAPPLAQGSVITQRIDRAGTVTNEPNMSDYGVTVAHLDPVTNHSVASVFWSFMNSSGLVYENGQLVNAKLFESPIYATGRPLTEPYWATVKVAGTYRNVLIQAFERRVLTYTPGNSSGFEVEAGNVGQHYYHWRYEVIPNEQQPAPPPSPTPPPTNGDPVEGDVIASYDLTQMDAASEPSSGFWGQPTSEGYTIELISDSSVLATPDTRTFGDASYSITTRVTDAAPVGEACLDARVNRNQSGAITSDYSLCALYADAPDDAPPAFLGIHLDYFDGMSWTNLGKWEFNQPVTASSWHTLKLIVRGASFWVYFDGQFFSTAQHSGATTGQVGFAAWDLTSAADQLSKGLVLERPAPKSMIKLRTMRQVGETSLVEFKDLVVRAIQ